jgi:hypothetical protein
VGRTITKAVALILAGGVLGALVIMFALPKRPQVAVVAGAHYSADALRSRSTPTPTAIPALTPAPQASPAVLGSSVTATTQRQHSVSPSSGNATPPTRATAPVCNQALKQSQQELYQANVGSENVRHDRAIEDIENEASERGVLYSGYVEQATNQEDQQHQLNLSALQARYNASLASINCGS